MKKIVGQLFHGGEGIQHAEEALLLALLALGGLAAYGPLASTIISTFENAMTKLLEAIA